MATMQHRIFCFREFIKTKSATAVQLAFVFNIYYAFDWNIEEAFDNNSVI